MPDKEPILVIDDDEFARVLATDSLKGLGRPVLSAASGYDALDLFDQHKDIALLVLDIVMPDMSGIDTLLQLRRNGFKAPVIVLTGYVSEMLSRELTALSPEKVMAKPYLPTDLLNAARALLPDS